MPRVARDAGPPRRPVPTEMQDLRRSKLIVQNPADCPKVYAAKYLYSNVLS